VIVHNWPRRPWSQRHSPTRSRSPWSRGSRSPTLLGVVVWVERNSRLGYDRLASRVTFPRIVNYLEGGSGKASRLVAADDQSAAIRLQHDLSSIPARGIRGFSPKNQKRPEPWRKRDCIMSFAVVQQVLAIVHRCRGREGAECCFPSFNLLR